MGLFEPNSTIFWTHLTQLVKFSANTSPTPSSSIQIGNSLYNAQKISIQEDKVINFNSLEVSTPLSLGLFEPNSTIFWAHLT